MRVSGKTVAFVLSAVVAFGLTIATSNTASATAHAGKGGTNIGTAEQCYKEPNVQEYVGPDQNGKLRIVRQVIYQGNYGFTVRWASYKQVGGLAYGSATDGYYRLVLKPGQRLMYADYTYSDGNTNSAYGVGAPLVHVSATQNWDGKGIVPLHGEFVSRGVVWNGTLSWIDININDPRYPQNVVCSLR